MMPQDRYCLISSVEEAIRSAKIPDSEKNLLLEKIRQLTPADVAPVAHATWERGGYEHGMRRNKYICPRCECVEYRLYESDFCPNCGANMRRRGVRSKEQTTD